MSSSPPIPSTDANDIIAQVELYFAHDPAVDGVRLGKRLSEFFLAPTLAARLDAFVTIKEWLDAPHSDASRQARVLSLLELMDARPAIRAQFQFGIRDILNGIDTVELFAEAGLHPRQSFWSEFFRRSLEKVFPLAGDASDFSKFISRLYPNANSIGRLLAWPDEEFQHIARLLAPINDSDAWQKQRNELIQAFRLLTVHVAGLGLSPGLRARSRPGDIEASPFYRLQQTANAVVLAKGDPNALLLWRNQVQFCRDELEYIHQRMEDAGVSTALVFDMRNIERALVRMEHIADVLFVAEPHQQIEAVKRLLDDVMSARRSDLSISGLFRENSALLARKIVERTGKTGEHYIANTLREYKQLWIASIGGGALTVFTAAIKLRLHAAHFPPFVEGITAGTNYAVSFLLLQQFHLALATKQPSVTAATFAGIVRTTRGEARKQRIADFVSRITRSQLASAFGNLIAVCIGCIIFERIWYRLHASPFLTVSSAEEVYKTLNPVASGTAVFAIITGLILWISALAGGWIENFATFNQIPSAIAHHSLGRFFGRERMTRFANYVEVNLSGWASSIVLGYLLGFTPALGRFLGVPLDVRHVTLSAGTLALAAASFGRDWLYRGWFLYTLYGITVTFILNLTVSFFTAASVALNAYGVSKKERRKLWRFSLRSFFRSPRNFLFPPSSSSESAPPGGNPTSGPKTKAAGAPDDHIA
ncbi:putative site-specific recombinase transmembrane protein [Candidatus Koribacter versatilis Ellin345]|uniref:Site-specific recombinase transmembrane protein n=1 Tax=Koribacter versatilis (strain Ellin345) TaxID=204669 RepID=Q1IPZ5_KORVE|nr:site-specific recombinase [Candidatus Koribacter versatilis]ABF41055.1 putative site-specific recombinase transmembrane protein [Candidatus Koribacter versatilis Ellin345]